MYHIARVCLPWMLPSDYYYYLSLLLLLRLELNDWNIYIAKALSNVVYSESQFLPIYS